MSENRSVKLHFFTNDHFRKFSQVCGDQSVNFQVERNNDGWYVSTEALSPQNRRKLVSAWGDASMIRTDE